jgi:hypothetical protein
MPIEGFLEAVELFQIRGWTFDSDRPDDVLTVEIVREGQVIGTVSADLYRADLERSGVGNGEHAFIFNSPIALPKGCLGSLSARVPAPDGQHALLPMLPEADRPSAQAVPSHSPLVFRGERVDLQQAPIFVMGTARSGTSAMAQALLKLFPGHMEGHFIDLLAHLAVSTENFYDQKSDEMAAHKHTMVSAVSRNYVDDALDAIFVNTMQNIFKGGRWVEKTPNSNMIHLAPRLKKMWPKSRFIFMKRRFFENLQSRIRKFPNYDFERNCNEWSQAMAAWSSVRSKLTRAAIEVDQDYLSEQPKEVALALRNFLSIPEIEAKRLGQALENDRPERTSELTDRRVDQKGMRWTEVQIAKFEENCLKWMDAYGYSTDRSYFKPGFEFEKLVVL